MAKETVAESCTNELAGISRLGRAVNEMVRGPDEAGTEPRCHVSVVVPSAFTTTESGLGPAPLSSPVL